MSTSFFSASISAATLTNSASAAVLSLVVKSLCVGQHEWVAAVGNINKRVCQTPPANRSLTPGRRQPAYKITGKDAKPTQHLALPCTWFLDLCVWDHRNWFNIKQNSVFNTTNKQDFAGNSQHTTSLEGRSTIQHLPLPCPWYLDLCMWRHTQHWVRNLVQATDQIQDH